MRLGLTILAALMTVNASSAIAAVKPELVSRGAGGAGVEGNSWSYEPAVSDGGRRVVFSSYASNLHPDDADAMSDVYVRDMESDELFLVSRASGPDGAKADGHSSRPAVSADGRYVAFRSLAENLTPDAPPNSAQIYVRDLMANTTELVSRLPDQRPSSPVFAGPSISPDGRFVGYSTFYLSYVRDLKAGTTTVVNRASGANGQISNGQTSAPRISADGSAAAFTSSATNLHSADNDTGPDVYVRDLSEEKTILVSRATSSSRSTGGSSFALGIDATGSRVIFNSNSDGLAPGVDPPYEGELFVSDLGSRRRPRILSSPLPVSPKLQRGGVQAASLSDSGETAALSYAFRKGRRRERTRIFILDLERDEARKIKDLTGLLTKRGRRDEVNVSLSGDAGWLAFSGARSFTPSDSGRDPDVYLTRVTSSGG